jgi:hypothetical protein
MRPMLAIFEAMKAANALRGCGDLRFILVRSTECPATPALYPRRSVARISEGGECDRNTEPTSHMGQAPRRIQLLYLAPAKLGQVLQSSIGEHIKGPLKKPDHNAFLHTRTLLSLSLSCSKWREPGLLYIVARCSCRARLALVPVNMVTRQPGSYSG